MIEFEQIVSQALAEQLTLPNRKQYIQPLINRMLRKRKQISQLQKLGWQQPRLNLLRSLRPILSLEPLNRVLQEAARAELAKLNRRSLNALEQCLHPETPIIAIVSCRQRIQKARRALQHFQAIHGKPWASPLMVTGNSALPDWSFKVHPEENWLEIPCGDHYQDLPAKVMTLMWVISLLRSCPSLLKADDDSAPGNPEALARLTQRTNTACPTAAGFPIATSSALSLDRGWHIGKSSGKYNRQPFASLGTECWMSGGAGYLLNSAAVVSLGEHALHSWAFTESMLYEDVCVSMQLQALHCRMEWLLNLDELGITSERYHEINQGQWQVPHHFLDSKSRAYQE